MLWRCHHLVFFWWWFLPRPACCPGTYEEERRGDQQRPERSFKKNEEQQTSIMSSEEESLVYLSVMPESILCSILVWVVQCARTYGPRGRRLKLELSDPSLASETISDARIASSPWESFRSASSARVFVGMALWSTSWRERWTAILTDLAKELRFSGDYVGGLSVAASALWAPRVVLDHSKRAALFAEIASCRLAARTRSRDQKPARFALRDASRALGIDPTCRPGHAARGGALVTFGRFTDAVDAFQEALRGTSSSHHSPRKEDDDDDSSSCCSSSEEKTVVLRRREYARRELRFLTAAERVAAREALAFASAHAKEARIIDLEVCLAEDGEKHLRCSIRSDAPLRQLLANIAGAGDLATFDATALFVVTDDLEIPSAFWDSSSDRKRPPKLRSVRYLDPDSTPDHAALQPGNVAALKPGTRVFCTWPSSSLVLGNNNNNQTHTTDREPTRGSKQR